MKSSKACKREIKSVMNTAGNVSLDILVLICIWHCLQWTIQTAIEVWNWSALLRVEAVPNSNAFLSDIVVQDKTCYWQWCKNTTHSNVNHKVRLSMLDELNGWFQYSIWAISDQCGFLSLLLVCTLTLPQEQLWVPEGELPQGSEAAQQLKHSGASRAHKDRSVLSLSTSCVASWKSHDILFMGCSQSCSIITTP